MSNEVRLVVVVFVRVALLGLAGWMALAPAALPGGHPVTRGGLALLFLLASVLVGEVDRLRTQFDALLRALRQATGQATGAATAAREEAVPILIRALGSDDADTREKAHRNLVRITGVETLPAEAGAWEAWWQAHQQAGEEGPRP